MADVVGRDVRDVLPEAALPLVLAQYERALAMGGPVQFEMQHCNHTAAEAQAA